MDSPAMLNPTTNPIDLSTKKPLSLFHRHHFLIKGHYFLFFSAFGILYPILNITLRSRGLSNTEISYINIIIPFIVFCTNPLCGFLADHTRRYLFVFNVILGVVTVSYSFLFLLPSIRTHDIQAKVITNPTADNYLLDFCAHEEVGSKCSSRSECGCMYQADCSSVTFNFTMNSSHIRQKADCGVDYLVPVSKFQLSSSMSCQITCSVPYFCQGNRYHNQLHIILAYSMLFIVGTNCLSNAITLGASIGFAFLPRRELFGQQRVWGTIGFGISAFCASLIYKIFLTEFVYIIMFSITTAICILITSFIGRHPDNKLAKEKAEQELIDSTVPNNSKSKKSKLSILLPLLKKLDVIVFFSLTFVWGMSYAGLDPYVFLYVDEIAPCYSHSIVGLMALVASISEVIAFYLAASIIKFLGTNLSAIAIFLAFALRFAGYYFIRRPYFFLCTETMHFFNFGILYVLIAQKADSIAPPGFSGTLQGIVYGISFGLGRGIGLIASSFIYTRIQSRLLFLILAIFNVVAAVLYGIYFFFHRESSSKSQQLPVNSNIPKIVIDPAEPTASEDPLLVSSANT